MIVAFPGHTHLLLESSKINGDEMPSVDINFVKVSGAYNIGQDPWVERQDFEKMP